MGDTLRYAQKMNLISMEPRGELTSTGYALANPGEEYLILQPNDSLEPLTVRLEAGGDRQARCVRQAELVLPGAVA